MSQGLFRRGGLGLAVCLGASALASPLGGQASSPAFALHVVGAFGGEPSITSDSTGVLYDSSPSGPKTFRSNNAGQAWTLINSPDNNSGDDCVNTDQQNSLYWCNLGSRTMSNLPLQGDVWKSTTSELPAPITSCVSNCTWHYGNNVTTAGIGTSGSVFGVDRQWVGSSITGVPPSTDTAHAEVVFMYHDFYGPTHIWVNISTDGGATFGAAQDVLNGANFIQNLNGSITAEGYTFCNTVPSGVFIVPPGKPHAGRIYVAWIAADPAQDLSGCNVTMVQSFHTAWIAYSDPAVNGIAGAQGTWIPQEIYDSGIGHDMSTPFMSFTGDSQGNPYVAFNSMDVSSTTNVATCAAEAATDAEANDPSCAYQTYVIWCQCSGNTVKFNGGGASLPADPNSAATPFRVSPVGQSGTNQFATIAAGDPGKVDVSWLHTPEIEPTDGFGKFLPLGCAGPGTNGPNTPPSNYPARCHWQLVTAQTLTLPVNGSSSSSWSVVQATTVPMHYGDICNLGIACAPGANGAPNPRHLLDFNMETVDPTTGCAHIAYADDNAGATYGDPQNPSPNGNHMVSADQTSGPSIIGSGSCTLLNPNVPEAPVIGLLVGGAALAIGAYGVRRRRQLAALDGAR
jgi:hypothetical protein